IAEGRVEAARNGRKRTAAGDGLNQILLEPLGIDKEEEFVFVNRPTQVAAEVVALERDVDIRDIRSNGVIAEEIETLAMPLVGARPGHHIDGARGRKLG